MIAETIDHILSLVTQALEELESKQVPLSAVVRKAIRVARLRNDYDNLLWLGLEMYSFEEKEKRREIIREVAGRYTKQEFEALKKRQIEAYLEEPRFMPLTEDGQFDDKPKVLGLSVPGIENQVQICEKMASEAVVPPGLHPVDLYFVEKEKSEIRLIAERMAVQYNNMLQGIAQRVHDYLSSTEKQIAYGQIHSNLFERNREYVELKLGQLCPDTIEQFISVYRRLSEGDSEAHAQALTSCRRILKSLADALYPPRERPIVGPDGKERSLTEDKYVNRLWQYVADRVGGSKSGDLLLAQLQDLGNRIDRLYDLACKGVHDVVSEFEVNQCVIQTYLTVGDILRLSEEDSAITLQDHSVSP